MTWQIFNASLKNCSDLQILTISCLTELRISHGILFLITGSWIGGNRHVISQSKRIDEEPFQVDPPRMVEMGSYQNPYGCFQGILNEMGDLIVYPEPDCRLKKPFICEYGQCLLKNANKMKIPTMYLSHSLKKEWTINKLSLTCQLSSHPSNNFITHIKIYTWTTFWKHLSGP